MPTKNETTEERIERAILKISAMTDEERLEMGERGRKWIHENRSYKILADQYLSEIKKINF